MTKNYNESINNKNSNNDSNNENSNIENIMRVVIVPVVMEKGNLLL